MVIVIVVMILFVIMGFIFLSGKGGFLIAGYNTASDKEKAKYDERKLNKCFAIFSFSMAILLGILGYVDTDSFALHVGLPIIIVMVIIIMVVSNTYCKKK